VGGGGGWQRVGGGLGGGGARRDRAWIARAGGGGGGRGALIGTGGVTDVGSTGEGLFAKGGGGSRVREGLCRGGADE